MNGRWMVSLGLLMVLAVAPASGQETVFGYFDGQLGGGNSGSGAMVLLGWALADSGIKKVVIQVDGVDVGQAVYGSLRPAVEDYYPGYPDSANAGFGYRLNTTDFANGLHEISVTAYSKAGTIITLEPESRTFHFNNTTTILVPFGEISYPRRNADLYGTCDPLALTRRYAVVEGWVLDLGVEIGDTGVGWVELLLDGSIMANTRTACTYVQEAGGLTQCYGLPRPGIEHLYPFALDAPSSGFRFVLDIGALINLGWVQGHHVLAIRASDISNQLADVHEIPVNFWCIENIPNEGAFGKIESPREGRMYSGQILFQGWAVDWEGVDWVSIQVDGIFIGNARYGAADGITDTRPSVFSRHSGFPDVDAPVWRMYYDSVNGPFGQNPDGSPAYRGLADGFHQVRIVVHDELGEASTIGERTFFVDNERE